MKFEVNSKKIAKLITVVAKARSKSALKEQLSNIYLELNDNMLTARATNLEITCEMSIPVKGIMNGKILLNGEVISKIINSINQIDVSIECELLENIFNINYQKNKINLKISPFEDFPTLTKSGNLLTKINTKQFINLVRSVSFCSASTEIKPEISSVYLYSKDDFLYSVATDSFRLAEKRIDFKKTEGEDLNILISQKSIADTLSILDQISDETDNLSLYKNENTLTIEAGDTSLSIRSINGNFPDYKQLFPKDFTTNIKVNKEEIKNILNLSTVFVNNYSYVDLGLSIENKNLKIKSKNDTVGELEKDLNLKDVEGDDLQVSYNSSFFLEGLSHLDGGEIEVLFTTSNRPMFLRSLQDFSFTYLLMPLNR